MVEDVPKVVRHKESTRPAPITEVEENKGMLSPSSMSHDHNLQEDVLVYRSVDRIRRRRARKVFILEYIGRTEKLPKCREEHHRDGIALTAQTTELSYIRLSI